MKIFSKRVKLTKIYLIVCGKYKTFEKFEIWYIFKKTLGISIVCSRCAHEYKKIFKEEKSIKILKILHLITNIEKYHKIYDHDWRKYKSII